MSSASIPSLEPAFGCLGVPKNPPLGNQLPASQSFLLVAHSSLRAMSYQTVPPAGCGPELSALPPQFSRQSCRPAPRRQPTSKVAFLKSLFGKLQGLCPSRLVIAICHGVLASSEAKQSTEPPSRLQGFLRACRGSPVLWSSNSFLDTAYKSEEPREGLPCSPDNECVEVLSTETEPLCPVLCACERNRHRHTLAWSWEAQVLPSYWVSIFLGVQ